MQCPNKRSPGPRANAGNRACIIPTPSNTTGRVFSYHKKARGPLDFDSIDAPDAPKRHWTLGEPSQVWTYRDAQAATLFHVLRFDPPRKRKVFLPLSLWRDAAGLSWRWNHVSPPR
jgi:hypothetical protein